MNNPLRRQKIPFGKKLIFLHKWNAWLVLLLALSGIVLSIGSIRGILGEGRVWLKQLHIWAGVVSTILLVLYLPLIRKHLRQIRTKPNQRLNLALVLFLLAGWIVTGVILWFFKSFPPRWTDLSLKIHGLLTWVGVPYALYHSITRMRWLKTPSLRSIRTEQAPVQDQSLADKRPPITGKPFYTRREFIKWTVGAGLALLVLPSFIRWLGNSFAPGGGTGDIAPGADGNRMLPAPDPLPESAAVIGGGSSGNFRVYTVTPLPSFTAATWSFQVDGLVDNPLKWNWANFLQLKRTVQVSDFHCVTGWSVFHNTWEGIRLADLLDLAGVKAGAKYVKFYSGDKVYTDTLTLEQARMPDIMAAVLHDGKPIAQEYGGPVRLVVPKMYGYKSVKWLERIELIAKEDTGYWEQRGYDTDAWVRS
jgi:hypothetical protein